MSPRTQTNALSLALIPAALPGLGLLLLRPART